MIRRILLGKPFLILTGLIAVYALAGFFLVPHLVDRQIVRIVDEDLGRDIEIGDVRFNPFTLRLTIEDLRLDELQGDKLAGFDRLSVDFAVLSSIGSRAWTLSEIDLVGPWVRIERARNGDLNLARLVDDAAGESPEPEPVEAGPPPPLLLKTISITNGRMSVADYTVSTPADVVVAPIDLTIYNLSTLREREGPLVVATNLPAGGVLVWRGDVTLQPLWSEGSISVEGWKPSNVWPFLRDAVNLEQPVGTVDLDVQYRLLLTGDEEEIKVQDLRLAVNGLELRERGAGEPMLRLDRIEVADTDVDVISGKVRVGSVAVGDGSVLVDIDPQGSLNWGRIPAGNSGAADDDSASEQEPGTEPEAESVPWEVDLASFRLENLAVQARERSGPVPLDVVVGGVDVSLNGRLTAGDEGTVGSIGNIRVDIRDTALKEAGAGDPPFAVSTVRLDGGIVDLGDSRLTFSEVLISGGRIRTLLDEEGRLNWERMFVAGSGAEVPETNGDPATGKSAGTPSPWSVGVDTVRVEDFSVALSDMALKDPHVVTVAPIGATLKGLSSHPDDEVTFELDLGIEEGGAISAVGSAWPMKPVAELDLELKGIALAPLAPYVSAATRMQLESGEISATSHIQYGTENPGALLATGSFEANRLLVIETDTGETLLGWEKLSTKGLKYSMDPDSMSIEQVVLDRPTGKFVINEDLTTNWEHALAEPEGAERKPEPRTETTTKVEDKPAMPVSVGRVKVVRGFLNFADLSLIPKFGAKIDKLNGSVSGLSTKPGARASGLLEGRVDEYGSAKIEGKLEPLSPTQYTDVTMDFRNVEMTSLSPYTIKFAGREIDSGKLSLDLEYKIDKSQLQGENRIVLDSLTLGEKVESPDAMNLPLNLAVALMKDANDQIDIGLPVSGDLANPEFSYGHLIWKALANLITNIVASPFRALGAMMGVEGEELEQVLFEAGRSSLPPPSAERLGMVAKALTQRPQLVLEVQGQYDPGLDGETLRLDAVRREVATRRGVKLEPGEDPGPVEFTEGKTRRALKAMFIDRYSKNDYKTLKEEVKKRLETAKQVPEGQSAGGEYSPRELLFKEMFDRLVEGWPLEDEALKQLADARAAAVQEELTTRGAIAAERIQIKASGEGPEGAEGADGQVPSKLGLTVK
ncbi:MAG: DUF748 domain-containing protein [Pseudomonadota bacterium]|nr:DUF748 domain-containing protein [Pseudomonadota bacterium]